jgi:aspartyl/asparaginyl beta-hydroxylase (cupin superfamily)
VERTASGRTSAENEQLATRAMMAGDFATARGVLDAWVQHEPSHLGAWLRRAAVCRQQGDTAQAFESLSGALKIDPRCFPALLMVATLLEREGDVPAAARQYEIAIAQAPPDERLDAASRSALEHGRQLVAKHSAALRDYIHADLDTVRQDCTPSEQRRLEAFIDTTLRLRQRYTQQPMEYCYPGMPSIEFYDRSMFPWLEELEAATPDIRRELLGLLAEGAPGFSPYVNYAEHMPLDQWRELNRSPRWTAWHFYERAEPIAERWARAPLTAAAFSRLPQARVPLRSPTALFSALRPKTRIPAHTGIANFRLLVHLALVIPPGCGFRVGGETRPWREGEAWVFDDTIEHEAWNDSDELRVILICDVWSPLLSPAEREAIAAVIRARDAYTGIIPRSDA